MLAEILKRQTTTFKVTKSVTSYFITAISMIILSSSDVQADSALLNLNFRISKIAIEGKKTPDKNIDEIPYRKVKRMYERYKKQTTTDRAINLDWNIVNYQATDDLFIEKIKGIGDNPSGYHLFDIIWFVPRLVIWYKSRGKWENVLSLASSFNIEVSSQATIKGYGNVPVYNSSGIQMNLNDIAQQVEGFSEAVETEESTDDFFIRVIKMPIIKSIYIKIDKSKLSGQKIEALGTLFLGSSGLRTSTPPFYYPWDSYNFDFYVKPYYPAIVNSTITDAEDLDVVGPKTASMVIAKEKEVLFSYRFNRRDIASRILLPIMLLFFTMATQILVKYQVRFITYIIISVFVSLTLPKPQNISQYNFLYLGTWTIFIIVIIVIEACMSERAIADYWQRSIVKVFRSIKKSKKPKKIRRPS